ncbi:hypothetical protein K466DRAFT_307762 [Polyporus arcularius HHB13444]|uniref:Uncharacterized protein n=1 Tax=Polyporus arcularius HHB13444 TaxID=1314778 RepID=A0A5C3NZM9_9APHY|nr:hypothetical protein K466DRAFT_307762 [Polyporus arcularius HHB13444]
MRSTPFTPVSSLPQSVPGQSAGNRHTYIRTDATYTSQVPHRYRVVVYRGANLPSEAEQYREFKDHTLDAFEKRLCPDEYWQKAFHAAPDPALRGVPLPDVALLRARAAMVAILHESAVVQALDGLRYRKGEEIPAADGESFMRHLRGLGYEGSWVCSS